MERKIRLQLPKPQNFIVLDIPTPIGKRQDGFKPVEKPSIPIESLSEEEANQYAEELKQQFLSHYEFRRENPSTNYNSLTNLLSNPSQYPQK